MTHLKRISVTIHWHINTDTSTAQITHNFIFSAFNQSIDQSINHGC